MFDVVLLCEQPLISLRHGWAQDTFLSGKRFEKGISENGLVHNMSTEGQSDG